jgi:hypothetical protein
LTLRVVILGDSTVKLAPLLATPPTVTTTLPVVAPVGTLVTMLVSLQLAGVAGVPLKVIELSPLAAPKFNPLIVTEVPTMPDVGFKLTMTGTTVNGFGLLAAPPTVTTRLPETLPAGTGTTMLVAVQLVGVPVVPLKLTALVP